MRSILSVYCRQCNVQEVEEKVMDVLGLALQARLCNIMQLLVTISRHRVDYGRRLYKIKIENDPKKQFWLLERFRTNPPWQQKPLSGHSSTDTITMDPMSRADQHPLLSKDHGHQAMKKKPVMTNPNAPKKDDQSNMKSKMTNTTAMQAAGMKQRSWMTGGSTPFTIPDTDSTASSVDGGGTADQNGAIASNNNNNNNSNNNEPLQEPINLAIAPSSIPLTDADLAAQLRSRTINRHDFLAACQHDHKLKRSKLHIQLLDLAPLVAASLQAPPAN